MRWFPAPERARLAVDELEGEPMKTILVVNSKGGAGKTTIATSLAAYFVGRGEETGLADADRQKSSLSWLKRRNASLPAIVRLDWSKDSRPPEQELDYLVVDAPGGLRGERMKDLVGEADHLVVPVLPSVFDLDASLRFLKKLEELKRIRKGKAGILVVANRVNRSAGTLSSLEAGLAEAGHPVLCRIADRIVYAREAEQGASIFDRQDAAAREIRSQWTPLLQALD